MAGAVNRFHTRPTVKEQDIAQHTFNMQLIAINLCERKDIVFVLEAILYHDLHEVYTGDIPANMKRDTTMSAFMEETERRWNYEHRLDEIKITSEEKLVIGIIDRIEFLHYLLRERRLGNRNCVKEFQRGIDYVNELMEQKHLDRFKVRAKGLIQGIIDEYTSG